jgi:hypothetical protein
MDSSDGVTKRVSEPTLRNIEKISVNNFEIWKIWLPLHSLSEQWFNEADSAD